MGFLGEYTQFLDGHGGPTSASTSHENPGRLGRPATLSLQGRFRLDGPAI